MITIMIISLVATAIAIVSLWKKISKVGKTLSLEISDGQDYLDEEIQELKQNTLRGEINDKDEVIITYSGREIYNYDLKKEK